MDDLGDSAQEQVSLRIVARWAAEFVAEAIDIFEAYLPHDTRPRAALQAALAFAAGKNRSNELRAVGMAALKAGKDVDKPPHYAARAATLLAAVAYTHTDLRDGTQGVRQAQHILGPVVYAALAGEADADNNPTVSEAIVQRAVHNAPPEVCHLLRHFPPQPPGKNRLGKLFHTLDSALRTELAA